MSSKLFDKVDKWECLRCSCSLSKSYNVIGLLHVWYKLSVSFKSKTSFLLKPKSFMRSVGFKLASSFKLSTPFFTNLDLNSLGMGKLVTWRYIQTRVNSFKWREKELWLTQHWLDLVSMSFKEAFKFYFILKMHKMHIRFKRTKFELMNKNWEWWKQNLMNIYNIYALILFMIELIRIYFGI